MVPALSLLNQRSTKTAKRKAVTAAAAGKTERRETGRKRRKSWTKRY